MRQFFLKTFPVLPSAAIFLSGSGTNAEKILCRIAGNKNPKWKPSVLVTDRPETSRARELAHTFGLPLLEHDIRKFYRMRGMDRVSIATAEGMKIREDWTDQLRLMLRPYPVDFGILAGFMTLCNITCNFPCLNIHPGDLTVRKGTRRLFAGLHVRPTETAILNGYATIRSSVILADRVSVGGSEMDEGYVLGISDPVPLDLQGHSLPEFQACEAERKQTPGQRASDDLLRRIAECNVNHLKEAGDWKLFPRVVDDFAAGLFSHDDKVLYYGNQPVSAVYYPDGESPRLIRRTDLLS